MRARKTPRVPSSEIQANDVLLAVVSTISAFTNVPMPEALEDKRAVVSWASNAMRSHCEYVCATAHPPFTADTANVATGLELMAKLNALLTNVRG